MMDNDEENQTFLPPRPRPRPELPDEARPLNGPVQVDVREMNYSNNNDSGREVAYLPYASHVEVLSDDDDEDDNEEDADAYSDKIFSEDEDGDDSKSSDDSSSSALLEFHSDEKYGGEALDGNGDSDGEPIRYGGEEPPSRVRFNSYVEDMEIDSSNMDMGMGGIRTFANTEDHHAHEEFEPHYQSQSQSPPQSQTTITDDDLERLVTNMNTFDDLKQQMDEMEKREAQKETEIQSLTQRLTLLENNFASNSNDSSSSRRGRSSPFLRVFGPFDPRNSMSMLENDTFTLMMTSYTPSSWTLGLFAFAFQMILGIMIICSQINSSESSSDLGIPFKVDNIVRVGQFFTIIICLSTQSDILSSIQAFILLDKNDGNWRELITVHSRDDKEESNGEDTHDVAEPPSPSLWTKRIFLPNSLKMIQGLMVLYVTFITILQSDDINDLLKDFTALMILSETDNIFFQLADYGFLGQDLQGKASEAKDTLVTVSAQDDNGAGTSAATSSSSVTESSSPVHVSVMEQPSIEKDMVTKGFRVRSFSYLFLLCTMMIIWISVMIKQDNGTYFRQKYPNCAKHYHLAREHFGDGVCYGGPLNTYECHYEDGDCVNFNMGYPDCHNGDGDLVDVQQSVGNGKCDEKFNTEACRNDGGDCCPYRIDPNHFDLRFKNGQCNGGSSNTIACNYDNGECKTFNEKYPDCPLEKLSRMKGSDKVVLGDGVCDSDIYLSMACGFEDGDCCPSYIFGDDRFGDGKCDGGVFNTQRCSHDNGDCHAFNKEYPNCPLEQLSKVQGSDKIILGDGVCDSDIYQSSECGFENGDCCPPFILEDDRHGDGKCNGGLFNTRGCAYDKGDCDSFNKAHPNCPLEKISQINGIDSVVLGDGVCDSDVYRSKECGFEDGDCICPSSILEDARYGDGKCDGGLFNTPSCINDNGDCDSFINEYPECPVEQLSKVQGSDLVVLGDGVCDSDIYRSEQCGYEDGDCICPSFILEDDRYGDGKCDGGLFNTRSCAYDNGDCSDFIERYPDCPLDQLSEVQGDDSVILGNGVCDSDIYRSEQCGYEDGDCICPSFILEDDRYGDGKCDGGLFNTRSCQYDNGDCDSFHKTNPDCPLDQLSEMEGNEFVILGDGVCDSDIYRSPECGFEDGDCVCPSFILNDVRHGDEKCDGGLFNTRACTYDKGDCDIFNKNFPECPLDRLSKVQGSDKVIFGDGVCDSDVYQSMDCGFEDGDCCPAFILEDIRYGDGKCDGGFFNTQSCAYDNGDCNTFNEENPDCPLESLLYIPGASEIILGDGICDSGLYSLPSCQFEFGDCDPGVIGQEFTLDHSSFYHEMSLDGRKIAIGLYKNDDHENLRVQQGPGLVRVYSYVSSSKSWIQLGSNLSGEREGDEFGYRIAMDAVGERVAISALSWGLNGYVKIFDLDQSSYEWSQVGQTIRGEKKRHRMGCNIGMTGDGSRIAIAAAGYGVSSQYRSGLVRIYELETVDLSWVQVGQDILGKVPFDSIGYLNLKISSLHGLRVMFSAGFEENTAIRTYEFFPNGGKWFEIGDGDISNPYPGPMAWRSFTISSDGSRLAYVSNYEKADAQSQVKVLDFDENKNRWDQVGETFYGGTISNGDGFGHSIAMSSNGNVMAISSINPNCDGSPVLCDSGSVEFLVFDQSSNQFRKVAPISSPTRTTNGNILEQKEGDSRGSIFGILSTLDEDGYKLSIGGYNSIDGHGFIKVYNLEQLFYMDCVVEFPDLIGDGKCEGFDPYTSEVCGFDGGDCL